MGLSIYYRMKAKVDAEGARGLVGRLHAFVRTLPFDDVSPIFEYDPPDGRYIFERGDSENGWKPGGHYLNRKRADGLSEMVEVPALHVVYFAANLRGSETASFGLASHPPVVVHHEDVIIHPPEGGDERRVGAGPAVEFPTRLRGWYSWSECCKTQYAANPKFGGVENFIRAHLSVFRVIDECKRMGLTTYIRDDAKYWRHRDQRKLLAELQRWDELIAGFAGRLSDKFGSVPGAIVAPIKDRPDYEHLEAKGEGRIEEAARKGKRRGKSGRRGTQD